MFRDVTIGWISLPNLKFEIVFIPRLFDLFDMNV